MQANRWLPAAIPAAFLIAALVVAAQHSTFTEFDGSMQLSAGEGLLDEGRYQGWASHFWPPLFPALIAGLGRLVGGFWAGKLISIASAVAVLVVVHRIARRAGAGAGAAVAAQALVAVNPLFFLNAIQAQNHMLDAALFCLTVLAIASAKDSRGWILAGLAAGAAGMTRYTSVVLVPAGILVAFFASKDGRWKRAAMFAAPAMIVATPWLYQNYKLNGSPIATWQHLNIGSAFLDPDNSLARWWWLLQSRYHNIADILRANPSGYLRNAGRNALEGAGHVLISAGAAIVVVPFALLTRGRTSRTIAIVLAMFFALVVQAFLRDYLFLSSSILLTTLGVAGVAGAAGASGAPRFKKASSVICVALVVAGIVLTSIRTDQFLARFNAGTTPGATAAAAAIRRDGGSSPAPVLAVHPIYAYKCGCGFLMAPLYYKGSLEGFVRYGGLSREVAEYAPRVPHDLPQTSAGYLVFNRGLRNFVPQYEFLFDPSSPRVPKGWRAIYRGPGVVVYKI